MNKDKFNFQTDDTCSVCVCDTFKCVQKYSVRYKAKKNK